MTSPQRWRPSGSCKIVVVDIAGFGERRSDFARLHLRSALYDSVISAFEASNIPFNETYSEDRGDGLLVIVPPRIPVEPTLELLPTHLAAILQRHNRTASTEAQLRVRMAIHVGEVRHDNYGITGMSLIHAFRLLEAPQFKQALAASDSPLALIVSERVYTDNVAKGLGALDPADFNTIDVRVKETATEAWLYLPSFGGQPRAAAAAPAGEASTARYLRSEHEEQVAVSRLFRLVDGLLEIPRLRAEHGRDQLVGALPLEIAGAIRRSPEARADLFAILRTCVDYPGGLEQLLTATRGFVGESVAVRRMEQQIALLPMPPQRPAN